MTKQELDNHVIEECEKCNNGIAYTKKDRSKTFVVCSYIDDDLSLGFGKSQSPDRHSYHVQEILDKLDSLGEFGSQRGDTFIGACAEPHAADSYLKDKVEKNIDRLNFSDAMRPRTLSKNKIIPYCQNCKDTFPQLN